MEQNNAPAAGQQSEREAFEAWAQGFGFPLEPHATAPLTNYADRNATFAWVGWQARSTLPAAAACAEQGESDLLDNDTFRKGIREDGTVEGYSVETYYLPCKGIGNDAAGFLRVLVDDNATDVETRVPHSALIAAGWVRASLPPPARNGEMSKDLAARIATALECGVLWTECAEAHPRMKNALADFNAWLSASCAPKQTEGDGK